MEKIEIVLVNEKVRFYDRIALFLFIVNGMAIGATLFYGDHAIKEGVWIIALAAILTALLIYPIYVLWKGNREKYWMALMTTSSLFIAYWVILGYWYIGVATLFLLWLYVMAKRELKVYVFRDRLQYPSFPVRTIRWDELNNMVLKDNLLTIDFKNNRLIQQPVDETSMDFSEPHFNEFCRKQIDAAASKT